MDQQLICNNKDISILEPDEADETCNWPVSLPEHDRAKGSQARNKAFSGIVSDKETKTRHEFEMEVEKDLEEEIKDGICHLALRSHRLYMHQKEKREGKLAFCEVDINIQMEGGTKIEINESKKQAPCEREIRGLLLSPRPSSRSSGIMNRVMKNGGSKKKFDWAISLRSSEGQGWKV